MFPFCDKKCEGCMYEPECGDSEVLESEVF